MAVLHVAGSDPNVRVIHKPWVIQMKKRFELWRSIALAGLVLFAESAFSFQLDAEAPPAERKLLNVPYSNLAWIERQIAQIGAPLVFSDPIEALDVKHSR